jgi:hypothetical protein
MAPTDRSSWDHITPIILEAWAAAERRGSQLLFVLPIFGVPLLAAAYWGIPSTPVPALIVLAVLGMSLAYLSAGRRRLRRGHVQWLRGRVAGKRVFQSTHATTREVSRQHFITLDADQALTLSRDGELRAHPAPPPGEFKATVTIHDGVAIDDSLWVAVMPHDGAIYFAVTGEGALLGAPEPAQPAGT